MVYSELRLLAVRKNLTDKSRDIWTATLCGLVVGGIVESAANALSDSIFAIMVGALVGGIVAAYVLYGKVSQAAAAGALSGILGTPFSVGVSYFLLVFGVIPQPPPSNVTLAELQLPLLLLVGLNLVGGAVGGTLVAAARHPKEAAGPMAPTASPGAPVQAKYCVQCGAQMPAGALVCPHCNARQPT